MKSQNLIAKAETVINTPADKVWDALINPEKIKQYMFDTNVVSDWKEQSPIVWKGEFKGKPYEDKGEILQLEPNKTLKYSHFSPLSGLEDKPENYHNVTIHLEEKDSKTTVSLSQDNNPTEESQEHSEKNWQMMLDGMKKFIEGSK